MIYILAIFFPEFISASYTRGLYKVLSQAGAWLVSWIPFSLAELILLVLPVCLLYLLAKGFYLLVLNRAKAVSYWRRFGKNVLKGICYMVSVFILFAGVNYRSVPLPERIGLEVTQPDQEDLRLLCLYLRDLSNASAKQTSRTPDGKYVSLLSFSAAKKQIGDAYDSLSVHYPDFKGRYSSSKPLIFSHYVSYAHIMGFFFPFTFEANINKDVPEFMIPAVMAHEQAHVRGFMREEEAEYAVYLLSHYTADIDVKYSFQLSVFIRAMNALYALDHEVFKSIMADCSQPLLRDLHDLSRYWSMFDSPFGDISRTVNDAYLKVNSQSSGIQSYDKVVYLLIADYKAKNHQHKNFYYENNSTD